MSSRTRPFVSECCPLWQWNTAPDPDEVERQVREMHRKGIGGFTIVEHPEARADSGERAWEQCLERARGVAAELGMSARISDDACWFARTLDNAIEGERASPGIDQLVVGPVELPIGDSSSGPALMVMGDLQSPGVAQVFGDKLGVSTAHCAGIGRTVSAPFASHRWPVSMEQMKAQLDRAAALGINMFLPCAWPYGLIGTNDGELPASVFYQSALWPHFRRLADYAARLCYALSQGDHKAQIALLNPVNSFFYEQERDPLSPAARLAVDYFNVYCEWLLKEHLDYDIVCEESISSALAIDQHLAIGNEQYALLIMPPMTAISRGAADKIAEYVEDGGALLGNTLLPVFDTQDEHPGYVRRIFSDIFGLDPAFLRDHVMAGAQSPRPRLSHNYGNLAFYESPDAQDLIPGLRHTVAMVIKPEVSIRRAGGECPNIICQHRTMGDHDLFFFANTAPVTREVKIALRCDIAPYVLDPETGSTMALPNCTQKGSRTVFTYTFRSHESLLVYFTDEIVLPAIPRATREDHEDRVERRMELQDRGPQLLPTSRLGLDSPSRQASI